MLLIAMLLALTGSAQEQQMLTLQRVESEVADRIQAGILDPILGRGKATAFVRLSIESSQEIETSGRSGEGGALKLSAKPAAKAGTEDLFEGGATDLFANGAEAKSEVKVSSGAKSDAETLHQKRQISRQINGIRNERLRISRAFKEFKVVVLHDSKVSSTKINSVRAALSSVYGPELQTSNIRFQSTDFNAPE